MEKSAALQLLKNILADTKEVYDSWLVVLCALWAIREDRSEEVQEVFRQLSAFEGHIELRSYQDGPHRCPGDQVLREVAQQYLSRLTPPTDRPPCSGT